jgi:peptidoglycan hydrolase-like protein with peptidoglycan-binding domain
MSIVNRTLATAPGGYATAAEVRALSGLSATTDISDADLNVLILKATLVAIGALTTRIDGALPTVMDAARTVFQLPTGLVADVNGDATVDTNDITVRFYKTDTDGQTLTSATGVVTVQDAMLGVIKTASALPADYSVTVDYARYTRPLELVRAKDAVRYLAAHMAFTRVKGPGKTTLADISGVGRSDPDDGSQEQFIFKQRSRWLSLYKSEIASINATPIL